MPQLPSIAILTQFISERETKGCGYTSANRYHGYGYFILGHFLVGHIMPRTDKTLADKMLVDKMLVKIARDDKILAILGRGTKS